MKKFKEQKFSNGKEEGFNPDMQYQLAYKKVKKIKAFYIHTLVFIGVNAYLIVLSCIHSIHNNISFWRWETFLTALFWGIGLTFHGFSVFGKNIIFKTNWEERKIQEFMEKDKNTKWE